MNKLLSYLIPDIQEVRHFKEITAAEAPEFEKLEADLEDLNNQFFIDTATWGLSVYEKELRLTIRPNKSLEERRSIVKAKWRGTGKVDAEMIKTIVEAYTRSKSSIGFDGRIKIRFSNQSVTLNMEDMFNSIEDVKPAHLGYDVTLILKQKESEIYIGMATISGEEITVYPYSPKELSSKGKVYIGVGSNTGVENMTVYPRKEVI